MSKKLFDWNFVAKEIIDGIVILDDELEKINKFSNGKPDELEGKLKKYYDSLNEKADQLFTKIKGKIYDFLDENMDQSIKKIYEHFLKTEDKFSMVYNFYNLLNIDLNAPTNERNVKIKKFKEMIEYKYNNLLSDSKQEKKYMGANEIEIKLNEKGINTKINFN